MDHIVVPLGPCIILCPVEMPRSSHILTRSFYKALGLFMSHVELREARSHLDMVCTHDLLSRHEPSLKSVRYPPFFRIMSMRNHESEKCLHRWYMDLLPTITNIQDRSVIALYFKLQNRIMCTTA